jgi:hypothetical protein
MENWEQCALKLELKYCERCGGLWLRPKGSDLIFCAGCARAMAGLVPGFSLLRRRRGGPENDHVTKAAFWSEGGNA